MESINPDPVGEYRRMRKEGRLPEALELARQAIPLMPPGAVTQVGKMLMKDLPDATGPGLSVWLLGQCTTSYLLPMLTAWAWAGGCRIEAREGGYDQVLQELMQRELAPDLVVVLPWHQRLLGPGSRPTAERVEDEMAFLQQAWAQVARLKTKLIQVSYDWAGPGPQGYSLSSRRGGAVELVGAVNDALRNRLPAGAFFLDLESVSAWHGKATFYDERNYYWLKQPFSQAGLSALAFHLATGVRVLASGRRKVLVLDLDNTLWGGVVGEAGPHGIAIGGAGEGEAFAAFQRYVKALKEAGIVLAICSKNNVEDAREPFLVNGQMVLKLEDIASFHATWESKPARVRLIAQELNLGLDSMVFFDDNPAERARMRAELPEVTTVEAPADPALYVRALQESLAFEAVDFTTADAERAGQYQAESSRRKAQEGAASPEAYLSSLKMRARCEPISEGNLDRVVDLLTKTNQFNLTTRRHSHTAVLELLERDRSIGLAVSLEDKFGEYGIVSVVLGLPQSATELRVDTWLMSCRAMGRTVEQMVLNQLAASARQQGYLSLWGEYLETPKNAPVKELLPNMGFQAGSGGYLLDLEAFSDLPTQVSLG